jgi:carbon storage regulator
VLVLTRKPGESILIGNDVRITLVSSSGTHARIAIEAPGEVSIHREEVYERIAEANREAALGSVPAINAVSTPKEATGQGEE